MGKTAKRLRPGGPLVMDARCKTGLVASKRGTLAHLSGQFEAHFQDGEVSFAARYLCGSQCSNVIALSSVDAHYGMCEVCEDAAKGPCVYRCFNTTGDLLYIGSAKAFLRRMQSHVTQSGWWPDVADIKVERFPTLLEARVTEMCAIGDENPIHNRQRPKRKVARRVA